MPLGILDSLDNSFVSDQLTGSVLGSFRTSTNYGSISHEPADLGWWNRTLGISQSNIGNQSLEEFLGPNRELSTIPEESWTEMYPVEPRATSSEPFPGYPNLSADFDQMGFTTAGTPGYPAAEQTPDRFMSPTSRDWVSNQRELKMTNPYARVTPYEYAQKTQLAEMEDALEEQDKKDAIKELSETPEDEPIAKDAIDEPVEPALPGEAELAGEVGDVVSEGSGMASAMGTSGVLAAGAFAQQMGKTMDSAISSSISSNQGLSLNDMTQGKFGTYNGMSSSIASSVATFNSNNSLRSNIIGGLNSVAGLGGSFLGEAFSAAFNLNSSSPTSATIFSNSGAQMPATAQSDTFSI